MLSLLLKVTKVYREKHLSSLRGILRVQDNNSWSHDNRLKKEIRKTPSKDYPKVTYPPTLWSRNMWESRGSLNIARIVQEECKLLKKVSPSPHILPCAISSNKSNPPTLPKFFLKISIFWMIILSKPWDCIFRKEIALGPHILPCAIPSNKPIPHSSRMVLTNFHHLKHNSSKALRVHILEGNSSRAS